MNPFESALTRYLTDEQLKAIRRERICIAGAGGLGSNVAVALVRTGFRHLEILDRDVVDASNLNRQDYTLANIGRPKVEALRERLLSINPSALIVTHQAEWTAANSGSFFVGPRIAVEAFDRAENKAAFVNWAADCAEFVISGNGMAGLKGGPANAIRRTGNIYFVGDGATAIESGHPPLAPRVIQCAARMAEIVLGLTLGNDIT